MKCSNCGKEIDDDSLFCQYCGTAVEKPSNDGGTVGNAVPKEEKLGERELKDGASVHASNEENGGKHQSKKEPFYKGIVFIIVMMVICPPAGIALAWIFRKPSDKALRIFLTFLSVLVLIGLISVQSGESGSSSSTATQQQQQVDSKSDADNHASDASDNAKTEEPTLQSISATYTGSTEKDTVIKKGVSGLSVEGTYSDGSEQAVTDYTIDQPVTLEAGETSTVTIAAGDLTTTVDITCTTPTPDEFKSGCEKVTYKDLARDPDGWTGKNIYVTGEVMQVQEGSGSNTYLVKITKDKYGYWSDQIAVTTDSSFAYDDGTRILEDDVITLYGTSLGNTTYTTVLGAQKTVPAMIALYVSAA